MSNSEVENRSNLSPQNSTRGDSEIIRVITSPPLEGSYSKYANRSAYAVLGVDESKRRQLYENALIASSPAQPRKDYTAESFRSVQSSKEQTANNNAIREQIKEVRSIDNVVGNQITGTTNAPQWMDASYRERSILSLKNPMRPDNQATTSEDFDRPKSSNSPSSSTTKHPESLTMSNKSRSFWIGGNSIVPEPENTNIDPSFKKSSITSVLPEPVTMNKNSNLRGSSPGELSTEDSGSDSSPVTTGIDAAPYSPHQQESSHLFCRRIQTTSYLNVVRFVRGSVPKILCASSDSTIHVYGVAYGKVFPPLEGHTDRVISLAVSNPFFSYEEENFHGDGHNFRKTERRKILKTLVASGSRDEILKVWDLDTGKCIVSIHAHDSPIWTVAIAVRKDSSVVVASGAADGTLRTWNGKTGKKMLSFKSSTQKILCTFIVNPVSDSPFLLSGGSDKCVHIWDLSSGKHIRALEGHEDEVTSISAGNYPGLPSLMPLLPDKKKDRSLVSSASTDSLGESSTSTHGLIIVSGSRDMSVRVWHLNTGVLLFELFGHRGCVFDVSIIRCIGKVKYSTLSLTYPCCCLLFALNNVLCSQFIQVDGGIVPEPSLLPPGTPVVLSGGDDCTVRVWSLQSGKVVRNFKWHSVNVRSLDTAVLFSSADKVSVGSSFNPGAALVASVGWDRVLRINNIDEALHDGSGNCGNSNCCLS